MIFHLELFQYSSEFNAINKITPNLNIHKELSLWGSWKLHGNFNIQKELSLWESWKLHGTIYHEGRHANSGHYTCSIRSSEKWYTISDSLVTAEKQVKLRCSSNNFKVPYILLYEKETNLLDDSRHLKNYMNHKYEDKNKRFTVDTLKNDGTESHITDKCLASKYPEVNNAHISNHENTPEAMNRK